MEHTIKVSYGEDICKVIFDNLDVRAKTVGIIHDDFYGTESRYELCYDLCSPRDDLKIALIPGTLTKPNLILLPEDVLGVYLYRGVSPEPISGHDVWVSIKDGEIVFNSNLPELNSGDKFVLANQMKTVVDTVTQMGEDEPVNMLFSAKSVALRKPEDWWIDLPEFTDKKHMAVSLISYIQGNQELFINVIKEIKDRVAKDMFGVGMILEFPECLNVKAIMTNGPRGKFVRIQVGMTYFSFSAERAIAFDWYKLMVDQLDLMVNT